MIIQIIAHPIHNILSLCPSGDRAAKRERAQFVPLHLREGERPWTLDDGNTYLTYSEMVNQLGEKVFGAKGFCAPPAPTLRGKVLHKRIAALKVPHPPQAEPQPAKKNMRGSFTSSAPRSSTQTASTVDVSKGGKRSSDEDSDDSDSDDSNKKDDDAPSEASTRSDKLKPGQLFGMQHAYQVRSVWSSTDC